MTTDQEQMLEQALCERRYRHHRHVWTDHVDPRVGNDFECTGDVRTRAGGVKEYLVVSAMLLDPDRWVDADMQRNGWLLVVRYYVGAAAIITALVIVVGVSLR